jgi:hypothetical protein
VVVHPPDRTVIVFPRCFRALYDRVRPSSPRRPCGYYVVVRGRFYFYLLLPSVVNKTTCDNVHGYCPYRMMTGGWRRPTHLAPKRRRKRTNTSTGCVCAPAAGDKVAVLPNRVLQRKTTTRLPTTQSVLWWWCSTVPLTRQNSHRLPVLFAGLVRSRPSIQPTTAVWVCCCQRAILPSTYYYQVWSTRRHAIMSMDIVHTG